MDRRQNPGSITMSTHFKKENEPDLSVGAPSPVNEFKVIKRTFKLFVDLDVSILWQAVGFITCRTVKPTWLSLHKFHVAATLSTSVFMVHDMEINHSF
jgi:hypothetical protein